MLRIRGGGLRALYIKPSDLDPRYDYDFTDISDNGGTFMRGNFEYKRPCGWKRTNMEITFGLVPLERYKMNGQVCYNITIR